MPSVGADIALQPSEIAPSKDPAPLRLITLDGGWFAMGADDGPHHGDGEGPVRQVFVDPFSISVAAITVQDFKAFIDATGYRTVAEATGHSFVFHAFANESEHSLSVRRAPWWKQVSGACWRAPFGIDGKNSNPLDHPVTHVSQQDAQAYCAWSGTRLPTEAQWEFAARGGLDGRPYPWGDELEPNGQHRSNVWQGRFPHNNAASDGHAGTAPAISYEPNSFGLYNMTGNVWEWTADRFTRLHAPRPVRNPTGPLNGETFVAKGGSYLCHASYCARYRTSSRQSLSAQTTTGNVGFRVVTDDHAKNAS